MATKTVDSKLPAPDVASVWLAILTAVGLIIWATSTHFRVPLGETLLPSPKHWFTSSIPVWIALVILGFQMLFLVASAVKATQVQGMGILDMLMSITVFVVTAVIITLVVAGVLKTGPNMISGLTAFGFGSIVELIATIGVWNVANRRPGGAIGGVGIS